MMWAQLWRKVRRFSPTDGAGLVILGVSSVARGVSYLPPLAASSASGHFAEYWLPLTVWAVVWIIVGSFCLLAAPRYRSHAAMLSFGVVICLHVVWVLSAVAAWVLGHSDRAYISAFSYATIVALSLWAFGRGRRADAYPTWKGPNGY